MRKKLIVANWKMNLTIGQSSLLVHSLEKKLETKTSVEVALCPSFLALQSVSLQVNRRQFKLGAQNCYWRDEGAYTGEVSAAQLRGLVQYVIVGHSERRHIFAETEKDIRAKVQAVLRNQMRPILCIGETATERADGETKYVIHDQLTSGLSNVVSEEIKDVTIAYEPVWAVGTGKNASPDHVKDIEIIVRKQIKTLYGAQASEDIRFLYGGSVTGENVGAYLDTEGIDGLLVGGASLKSSTFVTIVERAQHIKNNKTTDQ